MAPDGWGNCTRLEPITGLACGTGMIVCVYVCLWQRGWDEKSLRLSGVEGEGRHVIGTVLCGEQTSLPIRVTAPMLPAFCGQVQSSTGLKLMTSDIRGGRASKGPKTHGC